MKKDPHSTTGREVCTWPPSEPGWCGRWKVLCQSSLWLTLSLPFRPATATPWPLSETGLRLGRLVILANETWKEFYSRLGKEYSVLLTSTHRKSILFFLWMSFCLITTKGAAGRQSQHLEDGGAQRGGSLGSWHLELLTVAYLEPTTGIPIGEIIHFLIHLDLLFLYMFQSFLGKFSIACG